MSDTTIIINATDIASDVFAKVTEALKSTGKATLNLGSAAEEAKGHTDSLFSGFAAHVAEGMLLRDAFEKVVDVVKEGITAFPELVEHTIAVGNSLFEMSLKTGGSVENLSALRYVASQTGIDFDSFGNTLFKMEQALGASGAKADEMQNHLNVLGLNLQDLKNEKPDQAFIDIMSALEEIPNRADQAATGMAIFGKGFKDMAGLTQESITDLMQEARDLGLVMSTETAAAAHAVEIGFKGFSMQLEAVGMEVASTVLPALLALTKLASGELHDAIEAAGHPVVDLKQTVEDVIMTMLDWATVGIDTAQFLDHAFEGTKAMLFDVESKVVGVAGAFLGFVETAAEVANKIPGMRGDFDGLVGSLKDSKTWVDGFADGLKKESDGALDAAAKHDQFFKGLTTGIGDMKAGFHDAFEKSGEEIDHFSDMSHNAFGGVGTDVEGGKEKVDKYADAWANLNSIGESYLDTVNQINPELVTQIEYYVRAGAKVTDLATAYKYDLTPAQIDAIQQLVKANDKYTESWQKTQADINKIWDDALSVEDENNKKGLDLQLAKLATAEQNEKDAATKKIGDETQLQDAIDAITAKYEAKRHVATTADANKVTSETNQIWEEYYSLQEAHSGTATDHEIAQVQKWYDDKVIKAGEAGIVDQTYYDALAALADEKMHQVYLSHDKFYQDTKKMLSDLEGGDGGWEDTFAKTLASTHSFKDAASAVFGLLKTDVESIFADMLANILKGFFAPLEAKLGSFLAGLAGIGGGSGGGGWLAGLLALFGKGDGSSSSTPVTQGHWETLPDGGNPVWVPDPAGGGSTGGSEPPDVDNPHSPHEAEGGVIGHYAGGGSLRRFPGYALGVDRVPIWGQEGEGVLNTRAMRNLGEAGLARLNTGGPLMNTSALEARIDALHTTMQRLAHTMDTHHKTLPRRLMEASQLA